MQLSSFRQEHFQLSSTIINRVTKIIEVQLVCCDLVLGAPSAVLWEQEQSPTAALSCRSRAACGETPTSKYSELSDLESSVYFPGKGVRTRRTKKKQRNCLTNPDEHLWCWQIQTSGISLARVFTLQCYGFSTPAPPPPSSKQQVTHPKKKLLYSHLMGSFQNITPQF